MYGNTLIRVHRIERVKTEPRARVECRPLDVSSHFKLSLKVGNFSVEEDGTLVTWLDRGDISNLSIDCAQVLLDDDLEEGRTSVMELVP